MRCNVGNADRWIRIVVGLVVLAVGAYFGSWLGIIGIILLATGIFRFCPAYTAFDFSTIEKQAPSEEAASSDHSDEIASK